MLVTVTTLVGIIFFEHDVVIAVLLPALATSDGFQTAGLAQPSAV
jgi:hypothetical protein